MGYDSDWSTDSPSAGHHNRGKRRRKHKKSGIHLQKLIDPKTYSGTDDVSVFHRFMQDSYTYVDVLGNKHRRDVYHISRFLDGTARDFYNIVVSSEYQKWDLARFFRKLINYCFPHDFKTRLRHKIDGCYQGGRRVRVYAHKLHGMYHMLGDESERVQVIRLWRGMSKDITYQLLLQGFSEEVHTWDELLAAAEIVEGVLNRADSSRHADFWHECRSRSRCYDDVTERHKYCNIPRHRRD